MAKKTLIIMGPGGVGKSPLDALLSDSVKKVNPYRLRSKGPRDSNDIFYAPPRLHEELYSILGNPQNVINDEIEWFLNGQVLFFKVRDEWQVLFLENFSFQYKWEKIGDSTFLKKIKEDHSLFKLEIYAPILLKILSIPEIKNLFGDILIIILNPAEESLTKMNNNWYPIKIATIFNCLKRGDSLESIEKRSDSIEEEAPAWLELINKKEDFKINVKEYFNWKYPEYKYNKYKYDGKSEEEKQKILKAKQKFFNEVKKTLVNGLSDLQCFFKRI